MKPTLTYPLNDKQLIFDYVWHHFVAEGNPRAVLADKTCVYNTPAGGCAIGCLLPADFRSRIGYARFSIGVAMAVAGRFDKDLKNSEMHLAASPFRDTFSQLFAGADVAFLAELQDTHDCATNTSFADDLRRFARRNDLAVPQ